MVYVYIAHDPFSTRISTHKISSAMKIHGRENTSAAYVFHLMAISNSCVFMFVGISANKFFPYINRLRKNMKHSTTTMDWLGRTVNSVLLCLFVYIVKKEIRMGENFINRSDINTHFTK